MNRRQFLLGAILLATLLAVWWSSGLEEEDATALAGSRPASKASRTAAPGGPLQAGRPEKRASSASQASLLAELDAARVSRKPLAELDRNPFAPASFEPPPPPPAPATAPTPPPLRFKYLGKVTEGRRTAVFLDNAGSMLVARAGETLAGQYRVLSVSERSLQLEYLPLNAVQTLNFRE